MQLRKFRIHAIQLLWLFAVLPACSTASVSSTPPISSTRGMTLGRMATVIEARQMPLATQAAGVQQVTMQFDDGQIAHYDVSTSPPLQPGERVTVSETLGKLRIVR